MIERLKKIDWKKGNGEIIGFAIAMPCLILVFCAIIDSVQIALTRQNMDYTAYAACRAAVVSTSFANADDRADDVINKTLGKKSINYNLTILTKGNTATTNWDKGEFLEISVTKDINTLLHGKKTIESSLVMMIERSGG